MPMTTSVPAVAPAAALAEHGDGLADPGRGAEIDPEPTRCPLAGAATRRDRRRRMPSRAAPMAFPLPIMALSDYGFIAAGRG